jgi:glucan phosphoethanolaminetransferase (alkaline phosphatase superfamily)
MKISRRILIIKTIIVTLIAFVASSYIVFQINMLACLKDFPPQSMPSTGISRILEIEKIDSQNVCSSNPLVWLVMWVLLFLLIYIVTRIIIRKSAKILIYFVIIIAVILVGAYLLEKECAPHRKGEPIYLTPDGGYCRRIPRIQMWFEELKYWQ